MRLVQWLFVVIAAVSSVGCAPIEPAVWTTDGMYLVRGRSGALFLTPSPLDLSRYRGVVFEEIRITTKNRSRELKPSEEQRLKRYFTRRLESVFEQQGWEIVEDPGEDVLRVRLAVKDLNLQRSRRSHFGAVVLGVSNERIGIALELRDAVQNDRRLLFGDERRLPFGVYAGTDSVSIRRVEDAFYYFSIEIRRRLGQAQHGEFPPPPRSS